MRGGAIGDFILTLPALAALRRKFSNAAIHLLANRNVADLAMAARLVDHVRDLGSRAFSPLFAPGGFADSSLLEYFSGFDLVLSYLYDPEETVRKNLACCSAARFVQGPPRPDEADSMHATEVFLGPLEALGIRDADPVPHLDRSSFLGANPARSPSRDAPLPSACDTDNQCSMRGRGGGCLALHPGSGSPRKNWPEANWLALALRIVKRTHHNLFLIGGEAELDRLDRMAASLPPARIELARHEPLVQLAGRLAQCDFFLGHDSGITHLAAALGLAGLVLWGPSKAAIWRPRSDRMQLLASAKGLSAVPVDEVLARLPRNLL